MPDLFEWKQAAFSGELEKYEILSTLKASAAGSTCIARDRETGRRVVVKTAVGADDAEQLRNEWELLGRIHQRPEREADSFPAAVWFGKAQIDGQDVWALVRSCIEGRSLEDLVESRQSAPGMPREAALNCLIGVTELLRFLHSFPRPVIHRDVKPQNVIVDDLGQCHLIDLGISRERREDDQVDTRVMGTRLTAPPEQFGYRQTDERSDIFSAGVLLRYCFTGDYAETDNQRLDPDIAEIVRRATMFDPQLRYQRAEDMLRDLLAARYGNPPAVRRPSGKRRIRWALAALAAILCALAVGFGILHREARPAGDESAYTFREPLLEQAVRAALGKAEGPLTLRDLKGVTALHLFGKQVYGSEADIWFLGDYLWFYDDATRAAGLWRENGGIESLEDLRYMPNLRELCLYRQNISDISPLRGTKITRLGLGFNPLTDISPLTDDENITYLNLSSLDIADTRVIATLPNLENLIIGATDIRALSGLEGLPLKELNLCNVVLNDWSELARLKSLKALYINGLTWDKVYYLAELPLQKLVSTSSDAISLHDLEALQSLEILDFRLAEPARLGDAPLSFPRIKHLYLQGMTADSLNSLRDLRSLRQLSLLGCEIDDCAGLDGLDQLAHIICSSAQRDALVARYPDAGWEYLVDESTRE